MKRNLYLFCLAVCLSGSVVSLSDNMVMEVVSALSGSELAGNCIRMV